MGSLRVILRDVKREVKELSKVRDKAHVAARRATSLSKQAILQVHRRKLDEARRLLQKANEIISNLIQLSKGKPEAMHGGILNGALQEYAEACILLNLVSESGFVSPREIDVPPIDYVLGLADVIGECRRLALDSLREGDMEKSLYHLQVMEEIYMELLALDDAFMLVPGLRHKCDLARRIIEATRGDVTLEVGRRRLEKQLERLEQLQKRRLTKQ